MLTVETIKKVRMMALRDRKPIKQIARDLRLSKNTVRKILRDDLTEITYERKAQPRPALGAFVESLERWLKEDNALPRKRRRTAKKLFDEIQREGYGGSYDSVQRFVRAWHRKEQVLTTQAFVPLVFDPGEAFQFDWSHEDVELGGVPMTVKVAHIRLCYSRMSMVLAYPRETQEMVFDAHIRAFAFFGGACTRGIYDNMKTAVQTILKGKDRNFNKRFTQMSSHYLFEPVACTPSAGWEKGQVERQVGLTRGQFFVPRLRMKDLAELNEHLRSQSIVQAKSSKHPTMPEKTVWEAFEEERPDLMPVPRPFDGYAENPARVSTTALVTFDRNRYSVPVSAVRRTVQVRAYADRLVIVEDGSVLAEHVRQFGRDKTVFDPWHYLPLLERKPGALRNGAPFRDWALPEALLRARAALERFPDWDRQFVGILCAIPVYGLFAVAAACESALAMKTMSKDVVLSLLSQGQEEEPEAPVSLPSRLHLKEDPVADCSRYDALLGEAKHAA
ncbi:MAG: integrase catalytic [Desulfovibrionaceae bacterium]|nr:MAG: integrase catalytic [Desulfovibrionaceae bacterium]